MRFSLGIDPFGFYTAGLAGTAGLGFASDFRFHKSFGNQFAQLFHARATIRLLRPLIPADQQKMAQRVDSPTRQSQQALHRPSGKTVEVLGAHSQFGFGIDLVDILPTGSAGPGEAEIQVGLVDPDARPQRNAGQI